MRCRETQTDFRSARSGDPRREKRLTCVGEEGDSDSAKVKFKDAHGRSYFGGTSLVDSVIFISTRGRAEEEGSLLGRIMQREICLHDAV